MADETKPEKKKKGRTVGDLVIQMLLADKEAPADKDNWTDVKDGPLAEVPNTIKKQNRLIAEKGDVGRTYRVTRVFKPQTVKVVERRTLV